METRRYMPRWAVLMLGSSLLIGFLATTVAAQIMDGDAKAGQQLAQNVCSECHAVDAEHAEARGAAPSFLSIAKMTSTTAISLRVFLQTSHEQMPNFLLSKTEIDDVGAYILSLKNN
jgi:mono/diheme cytochrome c family protein